jgi:hypothetical protein
LQINGPFENCSSIDARGNRFVVARPGAPFLTSWGEVALPSGEPWGLMFVKLDPTTDSFCGLSHEAPTPTLRIWLGGQWTKKSTPFGRVIYDPSGLIRDSLPNGYQYWSDGDTPISRGITYPVKNGLNEWTIIGDLQVGQLNAIDGVGVYDGAVLRMVRPGYSILLNTYRDGENVTISFINNRAQGFIIHTTMGELRSLPEVGTATLPSPQPSPVPPPTEVPPVTDVRNQLATVERVRSHYPTPLRNVHWVFLVDVAQQTGAKLLRKSSGTRVTVPGIGDVSQDIIVFGTTGVDILIDGENTARAVWQVKEGETFTDVIDVTGISIGDSGGGTPVELPPVSLSEEDVNRLIGTAIGKVIGPLKNDIRDLKEAVSAIAVPDNSTALNELSIAVHGLENRLRATKRTTSVGYGPLKHSHEVTF